MSLGRSCEHCMSHDQSYVRNHPGTKKTPYKLWKGKKPSVSYFHIFGSTCYILNDHEHLGKFDSKSDTGVFLAIPIIVRPIVFLT